MHHVVFYHSKANGNRVLVWDNWSMPLASILPIRIRPAKLSQNHTTPITLSLNSYEWDGGLDNDNSWQCYGY